MNKHALDIDLINNIKENTETRESLNLLVNRHSGIYLDMVNSYASPNSPFTDYQDLIKDKEYRIYSAAIKYNENKGAKFSTYLGNETRWMCLNMYNKNKRKPTFHSDFLENMPEDEEASRNTDTISESIRKDLFNKVLSIISSHPDKRVEKIFTMRYVTGSKNKVMPWKDIGSEINLSIQGCINIHNTVVKDLQEELKQEI